MKNINIDSTAKLINGKSIVLGTCYYPEHWDRKLWAEDLDRMLAAGIRVVRIAEFAWNKFEPAEGVYNFDFFDSFLELAADKGMKVIFCTPTATPPAWLSTKYPEILNADMDGNLIKHGSRRHYNYNSPVFLDFTRKIVEQIAAHYAGHPAIIGWQLDNEFNCENEWFYSESDTLAFRKYVKEKYENLEELNRAWGTAFWNQTYTAWDEIDVPRRTNNNSTNPHRVFDYIRFISESVCAYAKLQSDILRKYIKPGDFITTNGMFGNMDNHRMNRESLDFYMYDSYPNFAYCLDDYHRTDDMKDRRWSRNLTEVRSVSPVFGIMEQQSGANGWNTRMEAPTPKPGQITLWTMQSIAHGADYVSYFRWRTCTMGTEIYWHGILDYSGRDNRRLAEIREVSRKVEKLQAAAGAEYVAKVGIIKDYDNIWDAKLDNFHSRVEASSQEALFRTLQKSHTPFDYVYITDETDAGELEKYDLLFYPHATILTQARISALEEYVARGGRLVMGCRTGYKDINGLCVQDKLPGLAAGLTGTDIPEYSFVSPEDGKVYFEWDGEKAEAAVFNDLLAPAGESAQVLGSYTDSYYAGTPALIRNRFGKGEAYYFGGAFAYDTVCLFLKKLGTAAPWKEYIELPDTCELAVREKDGELFMFVLNYMPNEVQINLRHKMYELLGENELEGKQALPGYGVFVFKTELKIS